jgi:hypothetical protein
MAASCVPVLYASPQVISFSPSHTRFEFVILFVIAPLLLAGSTGFLLGASILDPNSIRSGRHAAFRGLIVAIVTYLSFSLLISAWDSYVDEYRSFVSMLASMLVIGSIFVGWLVAIVGTLAGWLLFKRQTSKQAMTIRS